MTVAQFEFQLMHALCSPVTGQIDLGETDDLLNFAENAWKMSHPTGNGVCVTYTRVITKRGRRNEPLAGYFDVTATF